MSKIGKIVRVMLDGQDVSHLLDKNEKTWERELLDQAKSIQISNGFRPRRPTRQRNFLTSREAPNKASVRY